MNALTKLTLALGTLEGEDYLIIGEENREDDLYVPLEAVINLLSLAMARFDSDKRTLN